MSKAEAVREIRRVAEGISGALGEDDPDAASWVRRLRRAADAIEKAETPRS